MILTRNVLDALRLAAERDDGQCYQGWMTKEEFAACDAEGYVQRDFVHGTRERTEAANRAWAVELAGDTLCDWHA